MVDTLMLTKYAAFGPGEEASDKQRAVRAIVWFVLSDRDSGKFANSGSNSAFKTMAEIVCRDGTSGKLKIDDDKLTKY